MKINQDLPKSIQSTRRGQANHSSSGPTIWMGFQESQHLVHVFHPGHAPRPLDVEDSVGACVGLGPGFLGLRGLPLHYFLQKGAKSISSCPQCLGDAIPRGLYSPA
jgi:hypothetical protein